MEPAKEGTNNSQIIDNIINLTETTMSVPQDLETALGATTPDVPTTNSTTLGAPKTNVTTLGAQTTATTLGLPKTSTTTLGAQTTATTLGVPKTNVTTLGAQTTSTTLGAPKTNATTLGATTLGTTTLGTTTLGTQTATTLATQKIVSQLVALPTTTTPSTIPKKPVPSSKANRINILSQKIQQAKEERERLERQERERIKKEQAERKRLEVLRVEEEEKKKALKKKVKASSDEKKEQLVRERLARLSRLPGVLIPGIHGPNKTASSTQGTGFKKSNRLGTAGRHDQNKNKIKKASVVVDDSSSGSNQNESEILKMDQESSAVLLPVENVPKTVVKASWEDESEDEVEVVVITPKSPPPAMESVTVKEEKVVNEKMSVSNTDTDPSLGESLRSPICCVLGHVDTGKTKLLDRMRSSNVQDGEVGGITQQIGATYFPVEYIYKLSNELMKQFTQFRVPGLLVIDTPGHASFSSLRSRGSSLCDIAVLVVDMMHGIEPMTVESINLLRMRRTPFVVALNKVDRLFEWRPMKNKPIQYSLKAQARHVVNEFEDRVKSTKTQFAELGLNAELYMKEQLRKKADEFQCTVLEVKVVEGFGTTLDVILANGSIHSGDRFITCGLNGPIISKVKSLLTPPPLHELRIPGRYTHNEVIHGAQGFKLSASGLERALAGSSLFIFSHDDEILELEKLVMQPLTSLREKAPRTIPGVFVQASTLGALEALIVFLGQECKIPIAEFGIGPVHQYNVKVASTMLQRAPQYACILAFDVEIENDARELANQMKVKLFEADIIYHLQDMFKKYIDDFEEQRRSKSKKDAIFPCKLVITPNGLIRRSKPLILGVHVVAGLLRRNTPLVVFSASENTWKLLGTVIGLQRNHTDIEEVKPQEEASISIAVPTDSPHLDYGAHFGDRSELVSCINRRSIDALKEYFREFVLVPENYDLIRELKKKLAIDGPNRVPIGG